MSSLLRPVIVIDVDGVLAPFGVPPRWNPNHGRWLRELAEHADLAWGTSWTHQANWEIAPALGLPPLPVIETKDAIPYWEAPRPLVWIDDMFYGIPASETTLEALEGRETLFVGTNPHVGLELADFNAIRDWVRR